MLPLDSLINYHALTVAIFTGCTVETAFEKLQSDRPESVTARISPEDVTDMKALKSQGLTYDAIAEIYGMSKYGVYNRMRRGPGGSLEVKNCEVRVGPGGTCWEEI